MTHNSYRESYLNLLADCLCFELWDEPLKPLSATAERGVAVSVLKVMWWVILFRTLKNKLNDT